MNEPKLKPDLEVIADLHYIIGYADDLKEKVVNRGLIKLDSVLATRMLELATSVLSQVNLRTGPW